MPADAGSGGWRRWLSLGIAVVLVGTVAVLWFASRLPATYSMMDMGHPDTGGRPAGHHHGGISVETLTADRSRPADVRFDLVARQGRVVVDGREVDGFTVNGTTPGPTLRAVEGQLVEVTVRNENVADGMTLHWHGVDVPNAEDGVAGVTQDAIGVGASHSYRFVAQAGTYWYHSHQQSHPQVLGGLLGALVVAPKVGDDKVLDVPALVHFYGGQRTVNGRFGDTVVPAPPGGRVRVRVINTDAGPIPVWVSGSPYLVRAVDGRDLNRPTPVSGLAVLVTAGGRTDLEVTVPAAGAVRIQFAGASLAVGSGEAPTGSAPREFVDLLHYGTPAALGFDAERPDRRFEYRIGRRFGLLDGRPGLWWTINDAMFPDVPMYVVARGDVVRFTVTNSSGEVHPMHLHGHHVAVLSRNGEPSTGSPWLVDSLNVENGESYEIAFVADNPGVWMDHCHNLPHAREGLVAHLSYEGYQTPFLVGDHGNHPE